MFSSRINAAALLGTHDFLFITLDSLRFDCAQDALRKGRTPFLHSLLGPRGWELRHSPGNFTFAAHQAFFAGFLPTPAIPGTHPRLLAARFAGSETSDERTAIFESATIVEGLAGQGYSTICVGGVGFFNLQTPLGSTLPALFERAFWSHELGVTDPNSTHNQVDCALAALRETPPEKRAFLFLNVSATHQPNCLWTSNVTRDSTQTMEDSLAYVDSQLPPLIEAMRRRAPLLLVICSDHGTCYGEDGFWGHRLSHPCVWNVPYAERVLPQLS
ncbi:metalloenzyme domain-containing protein [bacterium]|nr:MAG: metalloenzyme domain-containing protein [bacterium]